MSFSGLILTNTGRNELAKAENGEKFNITHIVFGEGNYNGTITNIKELVNPVMEIPISKTERSGDKITLECDFNSNDVPKAFYWREIGIIANGKLCYYDNSREDAEYIDPQSGHIVKQKRMRFVLLVSSEVHISATVDSSLYALEEDLEKEVNRATAAEAELRSAKHTHDNKELLDSISVVNNTADRDKPVSVAQQAALDGKVSKSGDAMTGTLSSSKTTNTYIAGNQGQAIINSTAEAGTFVMLDKLNSTNGYFTDGVYRDKRILNYTDKSVVEESSNGTSYSATLLDESGNTSFPGTVTALAFSGKATTAKRSDSLKICFSESTGTSKKGYAFIIGRATIHNQFEDNVITGTIFTCDDAGQTSCSMSYVWRVKQQSPMTESPYSAINVINYDGLNPRNLWASITKNDNSEKFVELWYTTDQIDNRRYGSIVHSAYGDIYIPDSVSLYNTAGASKCAQGNPTGTSGRVATFDGYNIPHELTFHYRGDPGGTNPPWLIGMPSDGYDCYVYHSENLEVGWAEHFKTNHFTDSVIDFNNYTTAGCWACFSNSEAAKYLNCPTKSAHALIVLPNAGVTQIVIEFMPYPAQGTPKIYFRNYYDWAKQWGDWVRIYTEADPQTEVDLARHVKSTGINPNEDLNDFMDLGFYYCVSDAIARSLKNCPTSYAFSMRVEKHAGTLQEITEYFSQSPKTFRRNYWEGSGWGEWYRMYTEADPPTADDVGALPLSGGEMEENADIIMNGGGLSSSGNTLMFSSKTNSDTTAKAYLSIPYGGDGGCFSMSYYIGTTSLGGRCDLGTNDRKWRNIYATNGVIQTSDRTKKTDITDLEDEKTKEFIMGLKPVSYKMIDGTSGRTHYGLISPDIEKLMTELGMSSKDFAGFIKSPKVITKNMDEDGNPLKKPIEEVVEGEYDYALRYDEFIAPMIKTVQCQQREIEELREELATIKAGIQQ